MNEKNGYYVRRGEMWRLTIKRFDGKNNYRRLYLLGKFDRWHKVWNISKKIYYGKKKILNPSFTARNFLRLENLFFESEFNELLKFFFKKLIDVIQTFQ